MRQRDRIMKVIRDAIQGARVDTYPYETDDDDSPDFGPRLEAMAANIATVWWGDVQFYEEDRAQLKELANQAVKILGPVTIDSICRPPGSLPGRVEGVRALAQSVLDRIKKDEA